MSPSGRDSPADHQAVVEGGDAEIPPGGGEVRDGPVTGGGLPGGQSGPL